MSSIHRTHGRLATRFMDTIGDGTGAIEMNVNGAVTPVDYMITCPLGETYELHQALITIQDSGSFLADVYGSITALTNGVRVITSRPTRSPVEQDITAQLPIKTNADWIAYMQDVMIYDFAGGDRIMSCRFPFVAEGAALRLGPGDSLIVRIADDLTGITKQHIRIGLTEYPPKAPPII